MLTGRCLCGHVRFTASGETRVHYCHCSMCRRATGGAFAVLVWLQEHSVVWIGAPVVRRSSPIADRGFCGHCGTPLCLKYDDSPEIALLLGGFDQPDMLIPAYHYGVEGRLPWVDIGPGLPEKMTEERFGVTKPHGLDGATTAIVHGRDQARE